MLLNQKFTTIFLHQRYVELIILFSIGIFLFVCIFISILFILINLILILFFHSYTFSHSISSTLNFIRILFFICTHFIRTLYFIRILFFICTYFILYFFLFAHFSLAYCFHSYTYHLHLN